MNKLVFVAVVAGVWGLALFWITLEPPKTNESVDEESGVVDGDGCSLSARIQYEVYRISDKAGIARFVPKVISPEGYQGCDKSPDKDSGEEHDPRANQIKGGLQRRKVVVSTVDAFLPDDLIYSILSVFG
jgi:hypothetical protein